jgi:hypothetical protein
MFLDSMWENKKIVYQMVAAVNWNSSDCNIYHYRQIYLSLIPQQYFVPKLAKQLYFYKQWYNIFQAAPNSENGVLNVAGSVEW